MSMSSLCPFCFELMTVSRPCPFCGHQYGESIQGFQQLPIGWILDGKYRIGMPLGQGGFGITYLAYDMNLQQKVAIKEYFPGNFVSRRSQFVVPLAQNVQRLFLKGVDAFCQEAQLLARFSTHPNIVHIQNFFRENNTAYFVMEYVEGKSLAKYLAEKGGRLSQEETISLLSPIMDALDTLHHAGILHRDISPDNIYLTKSGQIKLLDFGAAKNELSQHTHSSAAILKPGYAPIEQYSVTGNQGPWTDVYAMGAVIYRCITGIVPPNAPDRISGQEITPISAYDMKVSKNVDAADMKALALNISDRWMRILDFKNALIDLNINISFQKSQTQTAKTERKLKKKEKRKKSFFIVIYLGLVFILGLIFFTALLVSGKFSILSPTPTLTPTITPTITPSPTVVPTLSPSPTFTPIPANSVYLDVPRIDWYKREIRWEDIAYSVEKIYPDGKYNRIGNTEYEMWIPPIFLDQEATKDSLTDGIILFLAVNDLSGFVTATETDINRQNMDYLEESNLQLTYLVMLKNEDFVDEHMNIINGIETISYRVLSEDMQALSIWEGDKNMLMLLFYPKSNEDFSKIADIMIASIRKIK